MPLYKITERRLKRKERDEEEGLAGLKAALREELGGGGDETDDEESESDTDSEDGSESDESSDEEEEEEDEAGPSGTEAIDPDDEEEDEGYMSDLQPINLDEESDEDEEEEEDLGPAPMSISEAVKSPIYPGTKRRTKRQGKCSRCVLCPGKTLQGDKIVQEHLASSMHQRAVKRYQARLGSGDPITTEDPRELVAEIFEKIGNTQKREPKKAKEEESTPKEHSDTSKSKSTKSPTSEPKSDTPTQPKVKKTKAERKAIRAQKLLRRIGDKAVVVEGEGGEVKLNRQARRLLAQQEKGEGKQPNEEKGPGEEEGKKEKKNKKSRKARKSLMEEKGVGSDEKVEESVVADTKDERKEKRQKKIE